MKRLSFGRHSPMEPTDSIAQRLEAQRARLFRAAVLAGRSPDEVTLIAVSKKQSVASIREAYAAGQRHFGENYVQELVAKADELRDLRGIFWHMIGHLQSNKCRFVTGLVSRVHTVDTPELAAELGRRALRRTRTSADSPRAARALAVGFGDAPPPSTVPLAVLVAVNIGGEESKHGCNPEEIGAVLDAIDAEPMLRATGLMAIPPPGERPLDSRPYFDRVVELRERHGGATRLPELSLGMSHDAEEAVLAGSTHVRIGTAIFGARPG